MRSNATRLATAAYLGVILIFLSLTIQLAAANGTATVVVQGVGKGKPFSMNGGNYWAGEIKIQVNGEQTRAYCMQWDVNLYTTTYTYTLTDVPDPDNPTWRAISYLLTWYDPPVDNNIAAAIQGSFWKLLTGTDPSHFSETSPGNALYEEATTKDVIHQGDTLTWLVSEAYAGPGETVTLTAIVKDSANQGRPNVKVLFETTGGTLDKTEGFTDAEGKVSVTLTAPAPSGQIVHIEASTSRVWPEIYLYHSSTQDLIGLGTSLNLTAKQDIIVVAQIHVVPEIPFGALAAVVTCFFAYKLKAKRANLHS
jgi:hypothetical protein